MKTYFLVFTCTLFFLRGQTQTYLEKMELQDIIKNEDSIKQFIDTAFDNIFLEKEKLLESGHSLAFEKFNKKIKINNNHLSVHLIPIVDAFAYKANDSNFALYLLINVDKEKIDMLVKGLGLPENIEEYSAIELGQFAFLNWKFESLSFWLDKDVFANNKYKTANKCILTITNMPISDVRNDENIFEDNQ
jgi:hypothetical protein